MIPEVNEKDLMGILSSGGASMANTMKNVIQVDGKSYDMTRAKMLIKHFLFTR